MKGDKLDKQIAASIRKQLEEPSVPYELGAWENFQKRRNNGKRKSILYWTSAIAAGLALIFVLGKTIDFGESPADSKEALAENQDNSASTSGHTNSGEFELEIDQKQSIASEEGKLNLDSSGNSTHEGNENVDQNQDANRSKDLTQKTSKSNLAIHQKSEPIGKVSEKESINIQKTPSTIQREHQANTTNQLIKDSVLPSNNQELQKTIALAREEKPEARSDFKEPDSYVAESEFPEMVRNETKVNLGMGVTPGFGSTQADNSSTSASSIGLGMLVDIDLPGKIVIGSGVALNYLNQVNEMQGFTNAYGRSYPQTNKVEVKQMQIEIPVFVKYPITRNNSISLQAGFSNLYAINQSAGQETTSNSPVPMFSANATGSSTFSIQNMKVQESVPLETSNGKFYPFATLNLGVNLRVLETKGANYVIMPFYNYQVKEISGYGNTYGLFGASFKVNFGGGGR